MYFKLLKKLNDSYISSALEPEDSYCITYSLDEWNECKDGTGGIFIFSTLSDVKNHLSEIDQDYEYEIWECDAEEVFPLNVRARLFGDYNLEFFWEEFNNKNDIPDYISFTAPLGTFCAKRIKLTKKVEYVD